MLPSSILYQNIIPMLRNIKKLSNVANQSVANQNFCVKFWLKKFKQRPSKLKKGYYQDLVKQTASSFFLIWKAAFNYSQGQIQNAWKRGRRRGLGACSPPPENFEISHVLYWHLACISYTMRDEKNNAKSKFWSHEIIVVLNSAVKHIIMMENCRTSHCFTKHTITFQELSFNVWDKT